MYPMCYIPPHRRLNPNRWNGELHFCHTSTRPSFSPGYQAANSRIRLCKPRHSSHSSNVHRPPTLQILYDGGTVLDYLLEVKSFLDQNPNDVLTLLFTNPESESVATVWKPIFDQAGTFSFSPCGSYDNTKSRPHSINLRPTAHSNEIQ